MTEKMQLENYGYAVTTVATGEKAVDAVQTSSDIDLILMDINLGSGIDGTQAAEIILENHEIPIVFLSSHTEPEIVEKTEKITSYGYVVKNSSVTVLDAWIKMAFRLFDATLKSTNELAERKRVEEALHESEAKFRALFEKGPIGVAYHRMVYDDSGTAIDYLFLDANTSYRELTGIDPRGKYVTDAFPGIENDPFDWIGTFARVSETGEQIRFEQYLQPNYRWYDCVGYQVKPGFFVAAFVEITERKRIEKPLSEKNALLDDVLENMLDLVAITDMQGSFIYAGAAHEQLGYSIASLIGRNVMDLVHPDDVNEVTQAFSELVASGKSSSGEFRYRCADGSYVWLESAGKLLNDADGKPSRVLFNTRDISERKRHLEELQASQQLNRALFDQAVGAIYIADLSGNFIDINRTACSTTGYTREELLEMTVFDLNDTDALQPGKEILLDEWRQWEPGVQYNFESKYVRKDGTEFPVLISSGAIHYGDTKAIAAAVMDITDQKHAEESVQQLLTEKETVIHEIQHRIRNNINTMTSLLTLQTHTLNEPTAIAALEDARNRLNSLGELYDYLYAGSILENPSLPAYLRRLVASEVELFPHGSQVAIRSDFEECPCTAKTLSTVGLIVNELVTNAMKYAFPDHPDPQLTLTGIHRDTDYLLTIEDNGPGFQPANEPQPTSGFGLTIVHALVEQLDGRILFNSDNGTRINLEFPIADGQ